MGTVTCWVTCAGQRRGMRPTRLQLAQEKLEGQKALERELGSAQLAQCSRSPSPDRPVGIQPRRQQQALPRSL